MILLALLILLPPLWREQVDTAPDDDLDQRNIKIARDRLAELKANRDAGGISQTQYDEQVSELELALSDDLDLATQPVKAQSQGRWLVYVLLIAIPVLSAALYWHLGDYQAITRINDPNQANAGQSSTNPPANMPSPEAINKMVAKLADKLKAEPNNLEGWVMLGRSYKVLARYPEAVEAFARAYQLAGDKTEVMLPYAEVLSLANNNNWAGKPEQMLEKALAVEPNNLSGLWLVAMAKAQQGDKKTALAYLRKLDAALPAGSDDQQKIHDIIANTETQLSVPKSDKTTQAKESAGISVAIQVSLAVELRTGFNPDDTVFIYAQAISGPKMPLAIIRKQVRDLPLSVSLSDVDSMLPNMKLSSFKEVRLLARISKTGNAMPQKDDLIGIIEQAKLADPKPFKIVINDRVK
jgi:cytochrome c-type biogenesis protein CcmH